MNSQPPSEQFNLESFFSGSRGEICGYKFTPQSNLEEVEIDMPTDALWEMADEFFCRESDKSDSEVSFSMQIPQSTYNRLKGFEADGGEFIVIPTPILNGTFLLLVTIDTSKIIEPKLIAIREKEVSPAYISPLAMWFLKNKRVTFHCVVVPDANLISREPTDDLKIIVAPHFYKVLNDVKAGNAIPLAADQLINVPPQIYHKMRALENLGADYQLIIEDIPEGGTLVNKALIAVGSSKLSPCVIGVW